MPDIADVTPPVDPSPEAVPLAGIRVLDFTRILAGPQATMLLADLGADVLKVERPDTGDDTRHWGPPFVGDDAAYYFSVNRNKRSITLDLADDADRNLAFRLAAEADVVVENFRPGLLASFSLGYEDLADSNLVYCSVTAFGPGPKEREPGYDIAMQALTGFMSITGPESGEPAKMGVALLDVIAGLYATVGILGALEVRRRTGRSQRITVPLFDASLAALANQASNHLLGGIVPRPMGTAHPNIVPYQAFHASDGYVVIAAANDRLFQRLCEVLGRGALATDERFVTNANRVVNRSALIPTISEVVGTAPVADWVERLTAARVPVSPVRDLSAVFASPEAAPIVDTVSDRVRGPLRLVKNPISGLPLRKPTPPPILGEHSEAVRERGWEP